MIDEQEKYDFLERCGGHRTLAVWLHKYHGDAWLDETVTQCQATRARIIKLCETTSINFPIPASDASTPA